MQSQIFYMLLLLLLSGGNISNLERANFIPPPSGVSLILALQKKCQANEFNGLYLYSPPPHMKQ